VVVTFLRRCTPTVPASRITRSTRLWLTRRPSVRSSAVMRGGAVGAIPVGVDLADLPGHLGIGEGPLDAGAGGGPPLVVAGAGDFHDPAQPLRLEGVAMIVDEPEAAQDP